MVFDNPSSLYAPPPPATPEMERILAKSLNPMRSPGNKRDELVSLRSKLWDAQKLARIILGRECIDLQNKDILNAIREVADMKQELKALRKQSRKYRRLKARLARQKALRESDPSSMALGFDVDESDSAALCSCCRKALDDAEKEATTAKDCDMSRSKAGREDVLAELESKVTTWQAELDALDDAQEKHLEDCRVDVQAMYTAVDAFKGVEKAADIRSQLDRLVETMSSVPTKAKVMELEEATLAYQNEEEKLKRALDNALEENRNLRDDNIRLAQVLHASSDEKKVAVPQENRKECTPRKRLLASRLMGHLVRRVYRKDVTKKSLVSGSSHQRVKAIVATPDIETREPHEHNATTNSSVETEDCYQERLEDSVESLGGFGDPSDGSASSEIIFGPDDEGTAEHSTSTLDTSFYYDVQQDPIDFWDQILDLDEEKIGVLRPVYMDAGNAEVTA